MTRCNCSICRRYGALWAYYSPATVRIEAPRGGLSRYSWRKRVRSYQRCKRCGCITYYRYRRKGGGDPVAVNARNFEPAVLRGARVRDLDGAASWTWHYAEAGVETGAHK